MITDIEIRNFRCFRALDVRNCKRINLIVGDNGVGKTSVLEAIFLTLSRNAEVSLRLKTFRGSLGSFQGSPWTVGEALWQDYFYDMDWSKSISISLIGSPGTSRSLAMSLNEGETLFSNVDTEGKNVDFQQVSHELPLTFTWSGADGPEKPVRPMIRQNQVSIAAGPMKSSASFFPAGLTPPLLETVERFSTLRRQNRSKVFIDAFTKEFDFISDLNIEVNAGQPMIYATLKKNGLQLPISAVSGGINRVLSICLAIASQPQTVIIVDEMEDGLFHTRKGSLWKTTLDLAFQQDAQLFVTTHDEEWLKSLIEVIEDSQIDEVSLWRFQRNDRGESELKQFSGSVLKAAIETGREVR